MQEDNSYSDEVLLCIGRDQHAVLAERVRPAYSTSNTKVLLPIAKWNFYPVGPEVLAALGLTGVSGVEAA